MKDLIITAKRQKIELAFLIGSFMAAIILNVVSIFIYSTSWTELFTQWVWMLILFFVIYFLSVLIRYFFFILGFLAKKFNNH